LHRVGDERVSARSRWSTVLQLLGCQPLR
jgi:hypothetical protein